MLWSSALAATGITLLVQAVLAGSLLRYRLVGVVVGALCCLPLLTLLLCGARARRFWRRVLFASLPLLALLLLAEVALRLFGGAVEPDERPRPHPRLGHVLEPGSGGTDARGWRNAAVPDRADVLFVGDSQTWGFFQPRDGAFPQRFAAASGAGAYQMALGSYGPVQYRELVRLGIALRPRAVVVGLYFGNDLVDAVDYAALEGAEDLRAEGRTYRLRPPPAASGPAAPNWAVAAFEGAERGSRALAWVLARFRGLLRARAGLLDQEPGAVAFADDRVGTLWLPDYRRPALDPVRDDVREGLRIWGVALHDMAAICRSHGAECVVLAIPTKEYTYQRWLRGRGDPAPALQALAAAEDAVRTEALRAAAAAGCTVIDLAEPLARALAQGEPVWSGSGDGHLSAAGHRLAAAELARWWSGR